jgi:hypothetical protein
MLIEDLQEISKLAGEVELTPSALDWGSVWYKSHWEHEDRELVDARYQGYRSRKQSHIHKLAIILSAARSNDLLITPEILQEAEAVITGLEPHLKQVLGFIGTTQESKHTETVLRTVRIYGHITPQDLWKQVQAFMDRKTFDVILRTLLKNSGDLIVTTDSKGRQGLSLSGK